jgi:hypothetical protein
MKQSQGWNSVIRFDDIKPVDVEQLEPEQRAEHTVCTFVNEFIDIFNNEPLSTRLACVAKLSAMVGMLAASALVAGMHKLPYVEPNRFPAIKDGKRLPLFHFTKDKPECS